MDISLIDPDAVDRQVAIEVCRELTASMLQAGQMLGEAGIKSKMDSIFITIEQEYQSAPVLEAMTLLLGLAYENACTLYDPLRITTYEPAYRYDQVYTVLPTLVAITNKKPLTEQPGVSAQEQEQEQEQEPKPKPKQTIPDAWVMRDAWALPIPIKYALLETGSPVSMLPSVLKQAQELKLYRASHKLYRYSQMPQRRRRRCA